MDIVTRLRAYPDDPCAGMTKIETTPEFLQKLTAENAALRAELAAVTNQRDALRDRFTSRKFRSGCCCHIDDETETITELCDLHREREDKLREVVDKCRHVVAACEKETCSTELYVAAKAALAAIDAVLEKVKK